MARNENTKQVEKPKKKKKVKEKVSVQGNMENWDLESGDNPEERGR